MYSLNCHNNQKRVIGKIERGVGGGGGGDIDGKG